MGYRDETLLLGELWPFRGRYELLDKDAWLALSGTNRSKLRVDGKPLKFRLDGVRFPLVFVRLFELFAAGSRGFRGAFGSKGCWTGAVDQEFCKNQANRSQPGLGRHGDHVAKSAVFAVKIIFVFG